MTALSVILPNELAKASQEAARKLGVSRTHFIRQAIVHELQSFQEKLERDAMIKSVIALRNSPDYRKESEEIDESLNSQLPEEKDGWWTK